MRTVDPHSGVLGPLAHANTTTSHDQYAADAIWTHGGLLVAWADTSRDPSSPDLRVCSFDAALQPAGPEVTLASSADVEADVTLAAFEDEWVAAWRSFNASGETVHAKTASGIEWSIGPFPPAPSDARPAVVEIDPTHLLIAFTEATPSVPSLDAGTTARTRLRAAILDTASSAALSPVDLAPLATTAQASPQLTRIGNRVFASWWTAALSGDPSGEDVWLSEVSFTAPSSLSTTSPVPLPRSHRLGDQRHPRLAPMQAAAVGDALFAAWDDLGQSIPSESPTDVVLEVIPLPMLRLPDDAGF
jgi:hypothetical protein